MGLRDGTSDKVDARRPKKAFDVQEEKEIYRLFQAPRSPVSGEHTLSELAAKRGVHPSLCPGGRGKSRKA
ncbi:hypothetical protein JCM12178A_24970 [Salidesulfovibrio brasiliensis]